MYTYRNPFLERCPICKARLKETQCPRCGAQLSWLWQIETQVQRLHRQTFNLLSQNRLTEARETIARAIYLKREPLALVLQEFIIHQQQNNLD